MKFVTSSLACLVLLSACAVGPDYERPAIEVPTEWRLSGGEAATLANVSWWEQFQDPVLNEYITLALQENRNLKIATGRVDEFLALYGVTRSQFFPSIDFNATYSRVRPSQLQNFPLGPGIYNDYQGALVAGWEIDLWGRIRRLNESAYAQALAQESARRGVVLSLVASVAQAYVQLRQLDSQLQVAINTRTSRKDSLDLVTKRFDAGDASELDVRQAEAEFARTQVQIPAIERQIGATENLLSILLGRNPGIVNRGKAIETFPVNKGIPPGLPGETVENRPDIIQAEQELIAANADIGAAKAEYFPRLSLTGLFGYRSTELNDWLKSPARNWQFGPAIDLPIFNAGRISSQVDAAEARKEQALWNYRRTVEGAFQDVEDALIAYRKAGEQREARKYQVSVLRRYVELAVARYEAGASNYLDVLDAQRSLFDAELDYSEIQGLHFIALIQVYRALGGGWVSEADKLTASPVTQK